MSPEHFDAVVIGSGFGGSVMAYNLARAGQSVCLLERGKAYPPNSFPRAPFQLRSNFWDPSAGLYGLYNVWSFKGSGALVSSGLGGGSLIYANVIIRKDERWFVEEDAEGHYEPWPVTREELDPHYDCVDRMLNVQKYPLDHSPYSKTRKTLAMREAAGKLQTADPDLDLQWLPLNLAVSFRSGPVSDPDHPDDRNNPPIVGAPIIEAVPNYHGKPRHTCILCGECDLGCNSGSKNTLDYTYITAAVNQHRPAEVRTLCEVRTFEPLAGGKAYKVSYVRHDPEKWEGQKIDTSDPSLFPLYTVTCKRLILSAGTFGTPYLLFRNSASFPGISSRLGSRFSVNGDLLSFIVRSRETKGGKLIPRILDSAFGPVITSAIRVGDSLDRPDGQRKGERGFYVEDGGNPYFMSWAAELTGFLGLARRAARFAKMFMMYRVGLNRDADLGAEIAQLIGDCTASKSALPLLTMGRDYPSGQMNLVGKYLDCDWSRKKSKRYYDRVTRVGRSIAEALDAGYEDNPSYRYFHQVLTAHPLGGCPMGADKDKGLCDSYGAVFGFPGLYVADGSVLPGPVGPNPAMTIAALSNRTAQHIVEQDQRAANP